MIALPQGNWFRWYVCVLLLLATTINYMDRQTLATAASRVKDDFRLNNEQYGELETYFGLAFAAGALVFGVVADLVSVRWLYPLVLVAWSLMGIATGWANTPEQLLLCRTLLGFFEAGHWPCALRTTQRLLPPSERTLGNSILQSGSSIGAIVTPIIMALMLTEQSGSWRFAFQAIGAVGLFWAVLWLSAVRDADLQPREDIVKEADSPVVSLSLASIVRRLVVLVIVVCTINACWHLFRVWLPLFLQEGRGYSEKSALWFTSAFYVATDVGCIAAGWATISFHRGGLSVGRSRWLTFTLCSLLTMLSIGVALAPRGPLLMLLLLLVGAGALGLFPCFYALSQEITTRHQGKLTGLLGTAAWLTAAPIHKFFGKFIDAYGSYDLGVALAGCLPLVAVVAWLVLWDWRSE